MNSLNIRKGDEVIVLSGKDRGKKGKVIATLPKDNKVLVEGVNMATKHLKPRSQMQQGGIIQQETPLYAGKVMRVCPKCDNPTRAGHMILADGSKSRRCKKCGEVI